VRVNDRNVPYIELLLNGELFVHGNSITYRDVPDREGSGDEQFLDLMMRLKRLAQEREDITEPEIFMEYQALVTGRSEVKERLPRWSRSNTMPSPSGGRWSIRRVYARDCSSS
jgi:hypothetical protein